MASIAQGDPHVLVISSQTVKVAHFIDHLSSVGHRMQCGQRVLSFFHASRTGRRGAMRLKVVRVTEPACSMTEYKYFMTVLQDVFWQCEYFSDNIWRLKWHLYCQISVLFFFSKTEIARGQVNRSPDHEWVRSWSFFLQGGKKIIKIRGGSDMLGAWMTVDVPQFIEQARRFQTGPHVCGLVSSATACSHRAVWKWSTTEQKYQFQDRTEIQWSCWNCLFTSTKKNTSFHLTREQLR